MLSLFFKRPVFLVLIALGFQNITSSSAQNLQTLQALENLYVSTAERKMQEVQRESDANAIKATPLFLSLVASNYPGSPVMYGAMNLAGGQMAGMGPLSQIISPTLHHVTSADSFFQFNVSPTWKQKVAAELGVPTDDSKVFDAWCEAVNNGGNIPESMLNPSSTGARANAWWSPDTRMERPSSNSRSQGDNDFFAMCQIVSLAPEWYPKGLVRINASSGIYLWIRPVSYDGMTSPLWVQRPPDQPARTGGNAIEALNKASIPLSGLEASQAYIISNDLSDALNKSPSVNLYSPDLNQVRPGSTPASQRVAKQQVIIVEEARESRRLANVAFRQYFTNKPLIPAKHQSEPIQPKIPSPKLTDSPEKLPIKQLKDEMRFWAKHNNTEHRGQRFQVERYQRLASKNEKAATTIETAAIELLNHAKDPDVLNMVIHLGSPDNQKFHRAILNRLTNKEIPLPESPGIRFNTLREDLLWSLADAQLKNSEKLASEIDGFFEIEKRNDLRLALFSQSPPSTKLPSVIAELLKEKPDIHQVELAAYLIGKHHPEKVLETAKKVADLQKTSRKAFMIGIEQAATKEWMQSNATSLRNILILK